MVPCYRYRVISVLDIDFTKKSPGRTISLSMQAFSILKGKGLTKTFRAFRIIMVLWPPVSTDEMSSRNVYFDYGSFLNHIRNFVVANLNGVVTNDQIITHGKLERNILKGNG